MSERIVLCIEPDSATVEEIRRELEPHGLSIKSIPNGEEAIEWGRGNGIYALILRVFRIPRVRELAVLPSYGGCKSWIELAEEIATDGAEPVLSDSEFEKKLSTFRSALDPAPQKSVVR